MDAKLRSQLDQFHSIEDFKVLYPPVRSELPVWHVSNQVFPQEELSGGKRSRNPSTSSGYGLRLGGYRSRRASEGDEGAGGRGGGGGGCSRGSSRHNSGNMSRPYRGRHSDQTDSSWVYSSSSTSSHQDKLNLRQSSAEVGRKNPSGPRKRANSASDNKVDRLQAEQ